MFTKILIANRGEIACRVMKTADRLGIATVAVYSEADAGARHVRLAGQGVLIGPAAARDSYLRIDRIIDAARRTGAQAIHPGYGFLSENEDFAEACAQVGLVFIGPPAAAIRAMGSKSAAKTLMAGASVPLVPGYHGENQEAAHLQSQADLIDYPVLIKASAGGGGKGMRVAERAADFPAALASCQREAMSSFGDGQVLLEKYLTRPRHIEIQVFADARGNCVHLFERDCSVQRRHQKVLEEAPAPGMTPERRREMGAAAVAAARAVGYVGAGTVEFIVDQAGQFYFMEMNTRLQVEHPVTEMITGQDLVEWQLRVAAGERLPLLQDQIAIRGHALEARVYAEDPARDFLPSTGTLTRLTMPAGSVHVRVDAGVAQGDEVTPYYDPMIAKLIVWDETRERALARMRGALADCRIAGVTSNVEFLGRLVASPAFAGADLDTGLIAREHAQLLPKAAPAPREAYFAAALATVLAQVKRAATVASAAGDPHSPWAIADGWRVNSRLERKLVFRDGDAERVVTVRYEKDGWQLELDDTAILARAEAGPDDSLVFTLGEIRREATVVVSGDWLHIFLDGQKHDLAAVDVLHSTGEDDAADGGLTAPIPALVVAQLVEPGAIVEKGAPLLVLEAMKMEMTILAPAAGKVRAFHYAAGVQVPAGAELADFVKQT